jgi:hypothetical protein
MSVEQPFPQSRMRAVFPGNVGMEMGMSDVDRMRYAAVRLLQARGLVWKDGAWQGTAGRGIADGFLKAADALDREIAAQCEDLAGAPEGSDEEREFLRLMELLQVYEAERSEL